MRVSSEAGNLLVSGQYLTGALGGLLVAGLVHVMVAGEAAAALLEDRRAFEDASAGDAAACDEGED